MRLTLIEDACLGQKLPQQDLTLATYDELHKPMDFFINVRLQLQYDEYSHAKAGLFMLVNALYPFITWHNAVDR